MECKVLPAHLVFFSLHLVLIETLWNVKIDIRNHVMAVTSINRNIMECKDVLALYDSSMGLCINRNIMECKDNSRKRRSGKSNVLIETLWNVKERRKMLSVLHSTY